MPGQRCTPTCGDGLMTGSEACDDGNTLAGDGCSANCLIEGGPEYCGDGMIQGAEECDLGPFNGHMTNPPCTSDCRLIRCGDGMVDGLEECDRGVLNNNATYGDVNGCTSECRYAPYCGDGKMDSVFGEMCDPGPITNWSYCTPLCKIVI
jgi:cysteine-rich repeat protein